MSVNGAERHRNNQMIDGADNNERLMGTVGVSSIDAIAEVKVQTNLYTAESGRTSGGVINVITKSGTNEFRGSAFEFVRNGRFDSRDFFATTDPFASRTSSAAVWADRSCRTGHSSSPTTKVVWKSRAAESDYGAHPPDAGRRFLAVAADDHLRSDHRPAHRVPWQHHPGQSPQS